jgi:hypothetical protein
MNIKPFFCLLLFFTVIQGFAQNEITSEKFHPHHSIGFIISHTNIKKGITSSGDNKWLSLPSWAINYNYKFKPKWAIGLHTDIVTETFEVEEHLKTASNEILERSFPIASAVMLSYKPGNHFSFMTGCGGEFSHTGNLFLIRIGVEYGYHLNKKWELNGNITNDLKINAYNSWAIGMGVTKVFF